MRIAVADSFFLRDNDTIFSMASVVIAIYACSMLLSAGVAWRLVHLARRTGQLPERLLAIASSCLTSAAVVDAGTLLPAWTPDVPARLSHALYSAAAGTICYATAAVFRPGAARPRRLALTACAFFVAVSGLLFVDSHLDSSGQLRGGLGSRAYLAGLGARALVYLWLAWEAGRYFGNARKGLRFGVSDPLVVWQFFAWCGASLCMAAGVAGALWMRLFERSSMIQTLAGQLFFAVLALVSGLLLWLTFVPPVAFARFIRARVEPPR